MKLKKYIVVTRAERETKVFKKGLEDLGYSVYSYPTIAIGSASLSSTDREQLSDLGSYDWIVFTSRNGVLFFMQALEELGVDTSLLQNKLIGAVGPKTAEEVQKYGLPMHFVPARFTTADLAQQIPDVKGKKVLLPRANIATPLLAKELEAKGARVTNIPIYATTYPSKIDEHFVDLLANQQILALTFTSPSTVKGLMQRLADRATQERVFSLPVLSIGPVTTQAAQTYGFREIFTADPHTIEGILTLLKENVL